MSQARCNYHHGDLRNALIIAAAELIERDGTLDFTMAEAAARAGVSAAAPYRHFADKEALLQAVRQLAILGLGNMAANTASLHAGGSIEGILAMGHTYLNYAREKRAFFSLMWEDRGNIEEIRENVAQEDHGGFMILVGLVKAFCEHHSKTAVNGVHLATQIWSMTHGVATLEASQLINLFDRSIEPEALLDQSVRTLLVGATGHQSL
ncbi:MAG: TetR-like C-terminal domain-containing protein [Luminiphilus sp.]|nr:TetR-like C-terminal domain-containing protein [Luminiphilus sp.]